MAFFRACLAGTLMVLAASVAEAGFGTSKNPSFTIEATRLVLDMGSTLSGTPACNTTSRFVADVRTKAGKSFLDTLNAAKQSGLSVRADGSNTCTISSDAEDLRSIKLSGTPFK